MDNPGDDRYDFWISLGSEELQHVGHWFITLEDLQNIHQFLHVFLHS